MSALDFLRATRRKIGSARHSGRRATASRGGAEPLGKKSKASTHSERNKKAAIAALMLASRMNAAYAFNGSPVAISISSSLITSDKNAFNGKRPLFDSRRVDEEDRSLFMTVDWERLFTHVGSIGYPETLPRWKEIPQQVLPYFFEASIRSLDTSRRVVVFDGRFGQKLLLDLKASTNPASSVLNRIKQAFRRHHGISVECYLVLEMNTRLKIDYSKPRGGRQTHHLPHPHGSLLLPGHLSDQQIVRTLHSALDSEESEAPRIGECYPKRAAYVSKQAAYTAHRMMNAAKLEGEAFSSGKFVAATNAVRARARDIWMNEVREPFRTTSEEPSTPASSCAEAKS